MPSKKNNTLFEILVCPKCKEKFIIINEKTFKCTKCNQNFYKDRNTYHLLIRE